MRWLFFISVLFFFKLTTAAQADSTSLKQSVHQLDRALLERDAVKLQSLLHSELSYGHSNGWVQTKKELIEDGANGKLLYQSIENSDLRITAINKKWAMVRSLTKASGVLNGNPFNLSLYIMQVWVKRKKSWLLLARQSAKH